jgi:hypothetical protein
MSHCVLSGTTTSRRTVDASDAAIADNAGRTGRSGQASNAAFAASTAAAWPIPPAMMSSGSLPITFLS